jgi:hypothetical protein
LICNAKLCSSLWPRLAQPFFIEIKAGNSLVTNPSSVYRIFSSKKNLLLISLLPASLLITQLVATYIRRWLRQKRQRRRDFQAMAIQSRGIKHFPLLLADLTNISDKNGFCDFY